MLPENSCKLQHLFQINFINLSAAVLVNSDISYHNFGKYISKYIKYAEKCILIINYKGKTFLQLNSFTVY